MPHGLKILLNHYKKESDKINKLSYSWKIQKNFSEVVKFLTNTEQQKEIDSHLDKYYSIHSVSHEIQVFYLLYKQVLFLSPREFVYVRTVK